MDPTAPKDNEPQNQNQPDVKDTQVPNPIQPGQYVEAGGDPAPSQALPNQPQDQTFEKTPPAPKLASSTIPGELPQTPIPPLPPNPPSSDLPPPPPQPDPTPYVSPQAANQPPQQASASGGKLKLLIIILAIIVLIGIVAALAWFFVLGKGNMEPVKTENTQSLPTEEIASPPPRETGGFGDLPTATGEATPPVTETESPVPDTTNLEP